MAGLPIKLDPRTIAASNQNLAPLTKVLVNRQIITDVTSPDNASPSIIAINSPGEVINAYPIPSKVTVTVINISDTVAATETNIFNESYLKPSDADFTIKTDYSDGFRGKLLSQLFASAQGGNGLLFYGFNVTGYDADGVKSDLVINDSNLTLVTYKGVSQTAIPFEINLSGSERNTQYKDGLLTVKVPMIVNVMTQLRMSLAAKCKLQFVFFTNPIQN